MADGSRSELIERSVASLARLRERRPRVHCLTNFVAMPLTANLLLAVGAVPSMTMEAAEMPAFVGGSAALLVNLGMLDPWRAAAIPTAVATARDLGRPWVLDPVKADRAPGRLATARALLELGPSVLRCNAPEAAMLAVPERVTLAVTGQEDTVTLGARQARLAGGSPLMDRVTAMGCAGSALVAAFLAVDDDPFGAAVGALLVMKAAGGLAATAAAGPGSFAVAFLDAVHGLDAGALRAGGLVA